MCCKKCSFCYRVATKERGKSQLLSQLCERCFLCRPLELCKSCHKCHNCCHRSTCRGKATPVLEKMGNPGGESKGSNSTQRGLHPPFPVQTQPNQITNCHKQLCQPSQKSQPFAVPVSAGEQKCGRKPKLPGVLQPVTQTQQPLETYLQPEHLEHLPKHRVVQNGDPRDNKNLPTGRGVGNLHRFQGRILPHTNSQSVQEVHAFSRPGSLLPIQSTTLGYQFDLKEGKARPTPVHWRALIDRIRTILSSPVCPVWQFMSLIGLLTATEKQVHLGRLHMRPIKWHLKNNWRVPESTEKVIPVPRSLHPHLRWWLEESNVLPGQPLHRLKYALQIFTDASKEGWGAHLNECTER